MVRRQLSRTRILLIGLTHFVEQMAPVVANRNWKVTTLPNNGKNAAHRRVEGASLVLHAAFHDVIYQIGGPTVNGRLLKLFQTFRRPIVLHWVGSDVTTARSNSQGNDKLHSPVIVHWADATWLQSELAQLGIKSHLMPSFAVASKPKQPLPNGALTVLLYLPDSRWDFYSGDALTAIAASLRTIEFLVVGSNGTGRTSAPNIRYLGWVADIYSIYARCHVLLRWALHDGLSAMVIEALSCGRHVIWNHQLPGIIRTVAITDIHPQLELLERNHLAGKLCPNEVGASYARAQFNENAVGDKIRRELAALLKHPKHKATTLKIS